ncbi:MAG: hypothetical protein ACEQSQ_12005 [Candidatus Paceibacteria bacterium]
MRTIVINTSWNIFNSIIELPIFLNKAGYRIVFIVLEDGYQEKFEELGFECFYIKINNSKRNLIENIKLTKDYYYLYKKINANIIIDHIMKPNIYGLIAAKLLVKKVIINISDSRILFLNDSLSTKISRLLLKLVLSKNVVFFQNNEDRDIFVNNKVVKKNQTNVVPISIINTHVYTSEDIVTKNYITTIKKIEKERFEKIPKRWRKTIFIG